MRPKWLVLVAMVLAGCTSGQPTASPAPQPSPMAIGAPTGLATFHEGGLVFTYPASWREYHYSVISTMSSVIAFLATV